MYDTTACPQCGCQRVQCNGVQTTALPRSSQTRTEEIASIEQEIDEIDDAIKQFYRLRAGRYRRLNEIQPYIAVLPLEIISRIFTFVLPPSQYNAEHLRRYQRRRPPVFQTLCAVSSTWRQTALETPELWTKLELCSLHHTISNSSIVTLLKEYLSRAGALPFGLRLHTYSRPSTLDRNIMLKNSHRFEELALAAPVEWFSFLGNSFTQLVHLWLKPDLSGSEHDNCDVDLSGMPALRHLTFNAVHLPSLKLPSAQLTTISLGEIPIDLCYDLLIQCPNIIEFRSIDPDTMTRDPPTKWERVELHYLQLLEWSPNGSLWDTTPFVQTHLSSLRKLVLWCACEWGGPLDELPTSCDDLEIHLPYGAESSTIETIFSVMPQLKRLSMQNFSPTNFPEIIQLLGLRSPDTIYLPYLQSLTIYDIPYGVSREPKILVSTLKARRRLLQNSSFHVQLLADIYWSNADREDLEVMKEGGLDLVIAPERRCGCREEIVGFAGRFLGRTY